MPSHCSHVRLFATLWTVACQAPLFMASSKNTLVGHHALFQGIFPTQGSNLYILCFLHWQVASLPLVPPRKPYTEHQLSSRHFCKCHREKDAQKSTPYWRVIP